MTLFEHLKELRYRLVVAALAIIVGMIVSAFFYPQLLAILRHPYDVGIEQLKLKNPDATNLLINDGITSPFVLAPHGECVTGVVFECLSHLPAQLGTVHGGRQIGVPQPKTYDSPHQQSSPPRPADDDDLGSQKLAYDPNQGRQLSAALVGSPSQQADCGDQEQANGLDADHRCRSCVNEMEQPQTYEDHTADRRRGWNPRDQLRRRFEGREPQGRGRGFAGDLCVNHGPPHHAAFCPGTPCPPRRRRIRRPAMMPCSTAPVAA